MAGRQGHVRRCEGRGGGGRREEARRERRDVRDEEGEGERRRVAIDVVVPDARVEGLLREQCEGEEG